MTAPQPPRQNPSGASNCLGATAPTPQGPDVSVVIVHVGPSALLRGCLRTLYDTVNQVSFETVVVDNLSGDGEIDAVVGSYPLARLVRLRERVGYGAATNRGIVASHGRYVLWCNNDLLFRTGALDRLVQFLDAHPDYGAVTPRLLNADGSFQPCFSLLHLTPLPLVVERLGLSRVLPQWDLGRHLTGREGQARDIAVAGGACSLIRRSALDSIGNTIDERFFLYAEEYDLSRRLSNAGWRRRYLPSAEVVHLRSQTTVRAESTATQSFVFVVQSWRSRFAYLRKHYGPAVEWAFGVLFAVTAVPRWAAARAGALVARVYGDRARARSLAERARLHAYSARMALRAERHEATRLPAYPPTAESDS
jgi:GT2 family glycosyltransferase